MPIKNGENNIHIDYGKECKVYHLLTAMLAARYGPDKFARVLDYGCGVGHSLVELHKLKPCYDLYAADAYKKCLDISSSRVILQGTYQVDDNQEVQIVDSGFDIVILSHVIEHTRDPVRAIYNCRTMLKDGGILVLVAPNVLTLRGLVSSLFFEPKINKGHIAAWDLGHWKNMLENYSEMEVINYSCDEVYLFNRLTPLRSFRKKFEIFLSKLFPSLSFSHMAVLRR